jgi:hypothetical protein
MDDANRQWLTGGPAPKLGRGPRPDVHKIIELDPGRHRSAQVFCRLRCAQGSGVEPAPQRCTAIVTTNSGYLPARDYVDLTEHHRARRCFCPRSLVTARAAQRCSESVTDESWCLFKIFSPSVAIDVGEDVEETSPLTDQSGPGA